MPPVSPVRFLSRICRALCVLGFGVAIGFAARPFEPVIGDPMLEPWRWRTFPELNGLNAVCMGEGPGGTMWFGASEQLWSYNGIEWKAQGLEHYPLGGISTFCRTADGVLYAGASFAILRLEPDGKWRRLFSESGREFGKVRKLAVARDGTLWAATERGALRLQNQTWTLFTTPEMAASVKKSGEHPTLAFELLPEAVLSKPRATPKPPRREDLAEVCVDAEGRVWFGTELGEILCLTPAPASTPATASSAGTWTIYNETDGMSCGRMASILPRRDGTVWVTYGVASADLNQFDGSRWTTTGLAELGLPAGGGSLLETSDGVVWFSGQYTIAAYRGGRWRTYSKPEVPIPTTRNFMTQSSDGALWIGGPGTEVLRLDYQTPRWLTLRDLIFQWESPAGAQWFLHREGRVVVCEAGRWTSYGPEDGVIDSPLALVGTRSGDVWVAGSDGHTAATSRFDGRQWTRFVHDQFSWGVEWRGVLESADGSLWFGAAVDSSGPKAHRAGILQYRDGRWYHHHQPGRAPGGADDNEPGTLLPATQRPEPIGKFLILGASPDGRIWAGRNIMIVRERDRWSVATPPPPLRFGIIETMYTTPEALWVGTRQFGALRYDGRTWQSFQGKSSLVANSVRAVVQTEDGTIWAATDRDISRFDGETWVANLLPAALNLPHDGGSLKASRGGRLWINRFSPEWTRRAWPKTPLANPGAVEFWTRRYQFAGAAPDTRITAGATHVSPPGNLSVLWSGVAPWRKNGDEDLQFSFRLDDGDWSVFAAAHGRAFFTLPPGPHRLEVRARDRDFNVDPTPATLEFVVLPPVWRQGWFLFLMLLLAGLLATLSTRIVLERLRLRRANRDLAAEVAERERAEEQLLRLNQELDERVQARTAQLEAANKELEAFSYSVSHDLRAPLRAVAGFSQALLEDYSTRLDADGKDYVRRIRAGALRMGRLIDDMLSLARVTREELRIGRVDLSRLVGEIATELTEHEPHRKVEFVIAPDVVVTGDARFLRLALENLIGNAWKFTAKQPEARIEFGMTVQDGRSVYFVRDNGAGFEMSHAGRLFQAFRRLHPENEYPGTGIGLATVHRIIRRHRGRVWAEGRVGEGATFYFTLSVAGAGADNADPARQSAPPFHREV